MSLEKDSIPNQIKEAQKILTDIKNEIHKVVVGQSHLVECLLIGLLADGHVLLEGVPGIAKTLAANTLAKTLQCDFKRIQFTPDLLPADLIGTPIFNSKESVFEIRKGPIFTNILLADEINRAPSKVQSALLEVMQEKQVTIDGVSYPSLNPFLVIATQNPIEQEGTYPLAEAQTDRFMMKVTLSYPSKEDEKIILEKMGTLGPIPQANPILDMNTLTNLRRLVDEIYLDDRVVEYLLNVIQATRFPANYQIPIEGFLEYGASPRASIALKQASKARALLKGRYFVTPEDIKEMAPSILRHRIRLSYEGEAENLSADMIIDKILDHLTVP